MSQAKTRRPPAHRDSDSDESFGVDVAAWIVAELG
jgi:hypothetical protein